MMFWRTAVWCKIFKMVKKSFQKKVNIFKGESNPFNMKINREKRCILGQKIKGTKGLRGLSRAESHAKRKELWQKTKISVEKASKFLDKRWMNAEDDSGVDRLVLERKNKLKKNTFNMNEESLTHKGMPLDMAKMAHDGKDGDSDDEQLDSAYVSQAHFGGFGSESKEPKSHKEIMEELIVESKKKKYEKKMEKEENQDLTENLDKGWKDFLSVVGGMKKFGNSQPVSEKPDPYDLLTNQLRFDKRGTAVSRTKTAEELEKEEKERIEKLEEERLRRMNADLEYKFKKSKEDHISADGIYDDFDFEPIPVEENVKEAPATEDELESSESEESVDDEESADESEEDEEMESEDELKVPDNDVSDKLEGNTSNIPKSMKNFKAYLKNFGKLTNEKLDEAVGDILKPCLKAKSLKTLKKLATFFGVLVEYSVKHLRTNINISGVLLPHLHTIAEISPVHTAEAFLDYLDQVQESYKVSKKLKKKSGFPSFKCILILKYCSVLFSVSDYRHPVTTPAMSFMCDILSSKFLMTSSNIISRLFVCSVIGDCVSQSKRFVPEVICFLNKLLQLAIPDTTKITSKETNKEINLVVHKKPASSKIVDLNIFDADKSILEDSKKLSIISNVVSQLHKFATLYTDLPSYEEIFSKTLFLCSQLPTSNYGSSLEDSIKSFSSEIKKENALCHLVYQNTKPKPLKLFEPSFESKFDKKDNIAKKFKLLKRVSQKIKKEEKSVLREMRRDAQMIAAEKLRETLESDAERKRKVKELYHELATQEGEYKKMMKKKP